MQKRWLKTTQALEDPSDGEPNKQALDGTAVKPKLPILRCNLELQTLHTGVGGFRNEHLPAMGEPQFTCELCCTLNTSADGGLRIVLIIEHLCATQPFARDVFGPSTSICNGRISCPRMSSVERRLATHISILPTLKLAPCTDSTTCCQLVCQ